MSSSHDDTSDKENKDKKNEDSRGRTRRSGSHSSRSSGSSGRSSSSGSDSSSGSSSSGSSSRSGSRSSRSSSSSSSVAVDVSTSDVKPKVRPRSASGSPRRSASVRKSRSPEKRNFNHSRRSPSRSPDKKNRKDDSKRGKPVRDNAEPDRRPRSASPKRRKEERRKRTPSPKPPRVYVSKLTRNVYKEHVSEIFSNYGQIKFIEMPQFRQFQGYCNKGFAYVEFETLESANKALRMDGGQIDGQEVCVELADFTHQPSDVRRVRSPPRNDYFPRGGRGWRRGPPRFFPRGRMRSPPTRRWSPVRQSRRRSRSPVRHRQYSRSSSGDSR